MQWAWLICWSGLVAIYSHEGFPHFEEPHFRSSPVASSSVAHLPMLEGSSEARWTNAMDPNLERQEIGRDIYLNRELTPIWSTSGAMWYRKELTPGKFEFWSIDVSSGKQQLAFDHQKLAEALANAGWEVTEVAKMAIDVLTIEAEGAGFEFFGGQRFWKWSNRSNELSELNEPPRDSDRWLTVLSIPDTRRVNRGGGPETHIVFINRSDREVELFWSAGPNQQTSYGKLAPGATRTQHTFTGHVWLVAGPEGKPAVAGFQGRPQVSLALIDNSLLDQPPVNTRRPGRGGGGRDRGGNTSPDGKWQVEVRDHNLWLIGTADKTEIQWSQDGKEGLSYNQMQWSPDSQSLVAFRVTPAERQSVHLIESSPSKGGRAVLQTRGYDLPGDPFAKFELNLFRVDGARQIKPETDAIDFGWPNVRWSDDGSYLTYQQVDRGHQRFRIVEVQARDGLVRNLVDQRSDTFIWTAHGDRPFVRELASGDLIFGSEHEGYHHLYWVDRKQAAISHAITSGTFVVRAIDRIDEEKKQIWFQASGVYPDQDPYLLHFGRVNFDGSGLTFLTSSHGNHSLQYDPSGDYALATWSRVDHPPVHELRRMSDGGLIAELVRSQPQPTNRPPRPLPEVFSAIGRDGETSIWGIICRPYPFDPNRKYPVIEDIYAGPHDAHVPKSFNPNPWYSELTQLGFIVVQIDGMGTAHRSKKFHDVCWQNLKDAGFPDRILWHRAVAERYPSYDIDRVGIYGTSAGGQNAAGAVLFHGDFYRAAAASCGCHDNRMDKASWNEQWMGYPVGPHYAASSNIDNAHRLQGKLFLLVGELDTNVPPESTLRFVDALIKADRDFDFLMIPGMGHSDGGSYGRRRIREFFVKHLQPEQVLPVEQTD